MNGLGCNLLEITQALVLSHESLRHNRQWEAANSLNTTVGLLRHQLEIEALDYERMVKG